MDLIVAKVCVGILFLLALLAIPVGIVYLYWGVLVFWNLLLEEGGPPISAREKKKNGEDGLN